MKGAQRSIFWEHLECLNNAPLSDGQSRAEEVGMVTEYLFSKKYRECFRIYDSAPKHRSWVVRHAFVSVVSESPPESYRKTVIRDITLPTRDSIREC